MSDRPSYTADTVVPTESAAEYAAKTAPRFFTESGKPVLLPTGKVER